MKAIKITRLVLGILSCLLFFLVMFQSCAANFVEAMEENTESTASASGVIVAILLVVSGVVAIVARGSAVAGFICGGLYAIAGVIGIAFHGMYGDLVIWSALSLAFAVAFIVTSIIMLVKKLK